MRSIGFILLTSIYLWSSPCKKALTPDDSPLKVLKLSLTKNTLEGQKELTKAVQILLNNENFDEGFWGGVSFMIHEVLTNAYKGVQEGFIRLAAAQMNHLYPDTKTMVESVVNDRLKMDVFRQIVDRAYKLLDAKSRTISISFFRQETTLIIQIDNFVPLPLSKAVKEKLTASVSLKDLANRDTLADLYELAEQNTTDLSDAEAAKYVNQLALKNGIPKSALPCSSGNIGTASLMSQKGEYSFIPSNTGEIVRLRLPYENIFKK